MRSISLTPVGNSAQILIVVEVSIPLVSASYTRHEGQRSLI